MQRQVLFTVNPKKCIGICSLGHSSSLRTSNLTSSIHTFCEQHWAPRHEQFPPLILQVTMLRMRIKITLQHIKVYLPGKRTRNKETSPDIAVRWDPRSGLSAPAVHWLVACLGLGCAPGKGWRSSHPSEWKQHCYSHSTTLDITSMVGSWCWLGLDSFQVSQLGWSLTWRSNTECSAQKHAQSQWQRRSCTYQDCKLQTLVRPSPTTFRISSEGFSH